MVAHLSAGPAEQLNRQEREIAFCARKTEMCLRGALQADEDAEQTKDRRFEVIARESRQDAVGYSEQAFRIARAM